MPKHKTFGTKLKRIVFDGTYVSKFAREIDQSAAVLTKILFFRTI